MKLIDSHSTLTSLPYLYLKENQLLQKTKPKRPAWLSKMHSKCPDKHLEENCFFFCCTKLILKNISEFIGKTSDRVVEIPFYVSRRTL